jgi:two-component system OmpR family response regulator
MSSRILIIEDDRELCQELEEILRDDGYVVETAPDGSKGKERLAGGRFDKVILDYKMPNSSGIEVLKFIKEKNLKIQVFIISGKPFIEQMVKEENLSSLVTHFINKPFSIKTLLENIHAS